MTDIIMKKVTTTTTTTVPTTTTHSTSSSTPVPIRLSGDYIRRPSEEFLLYIKQVEERKKQKRLEQFLNRPVMTVHQETIRDLTVPSLLDNSVLIPVLVSVIVVVSILTVTLLVFTLRRRSKVRK